MIPYTEGFRFGAEEALIVVCPKFLVDVWCVLEQCVAADVIVIMQVVNTYLTGGSTPDGNEYDRTTVIINTIRICDIRLIDKNREKYLKRQKIYRFKG